MRISIFFGWLVIILVSLLPLFLLIHFGPGFDYTSFSDVTHKIGETAGLMGLTIFAITFILSTRIGFIEDVFGGLDKVYVVHGILGGTALMLLLFHPIFLVLKFIPSNIYQAAIYLLPSAHWSVNLGIIAMLGLIGLIYFTLYTKIKYNHWKFSHKFLGLVFIFAILHVFLVRVDASRDFIFAGYYVYITLVSIIGLGGFSYSLFIKDRMLQEAIFLIEKIENVDKEKGVYELTFAPEGKPLNYQSGQFVFVRFYNEGLSEESHPFTIASKSDDPKIKIVVKNLGDFTGNLDKLRIGNKVSIEGPYGRFHFDKRYGDEVWIAGGIGITPFLGMAEDVKKRPNDKIYLFFSVKEDSDFISKNNLELIQKSNKNFHFVPWITSKNGFLTAEEIRKKTGDFKDRDFFICGPPGFKSSIKQSLIRMGVSSSRIHEEDFDFK